MNVADALRAWLESPHAGERLCLDRETVGRIVRNIDASGNDELEALKTAVEEWRREELDNIYLIEAACAFVDAIARVQGAAA